MSKKPPNRPGISFEVGARVEAQDYLQKWYPSRVEQVDCEEGKMLVHFDRWSHRYDEWILWDSPRLRPLDRPAPAPRKEEDETTERLSEMTASRPAQPPGRTEDQTDLQPQRQELQGGEEVLARWTDCRYYPAKIESVNKDGSYTVQFYDGVIRCVKRIHIKSMPDDARGQDWVALVKAASASGSAKPRTSANSNKDRGEARGSRSEEEEEEEEEEDLHEQQPHSEKLGNHDDAADSRDGQEKEPMTAGESSQSPAPSKTLSLRHSGDHAQTPAPAPGPGTDTAPPEPPAPAPAPRPSEQRRRRSQRLAIAPPPDPAQRPPEPRPAHRDSSSSSEGPVVNCTEGEESTHHNYCAGMPPTPPPSTLSQPPITAQNQLTDGGAANQTAVGEKPPPPAAAPGLKRTPKLNKHTREPIMNTRRGDDALSPSDQEHSQFLCQIPGCSKSFRKAKLLDYHLKYYHSLGSSPLQQPDTPSPDRHPSPASGPAPGRCRTTSACVLSTALPTMLLDTHDRKRRRTVSTSSSLSPQGVVFQLDCPGVGGGVGGLKPPRTGRKKRSSASMSSDSTEVSLPPSLPPPPRDRSFHSLHDKILLKALDKDTCLETGLIRTEKRVKLEDKNLQGRGKEKQRRDRKEKDPFKTKQKKKKKKKKKSKQHCYHDYEDVSLAFLGRSSSPLLQRASASSFPLPPPPSSSTRHQYQFPRAILSVDLTGENLSDMDFLDDSTTESLLLSGDEYNQEVDSCMSEFPEEEEEEEEEEGDASQEIVRCVCGMDEENGFMIQCEECMCWQHSVCMGLLEDSIPDQYICYICRDPPGQRWSAKYLHDRDWLSKGHMFGLSFLRENYSQQNAAQILSTHQLLADACAVQTLLHGLALKMDVLQNRGSPSLHLWARSWVNSDEHQPMGGLPDCLHFPQLLPPHPDTYIASEHSYQKPPGPAPGPAPELRPADSREGEESEHGASADTGSGEEREQACVAVCVSGRGADSVEHARSCLQWQMNLLTHMEDVQNQLAGRMDLIEKELDVLERWLVLPGEAEPPPPLARLPQLKLRIKQLLTDLSKVQTMSTLCSV